MKAHIRPIWQLGRPLLWECRGRAFDCGWIYLGKLRGHGNDPHEAYQDWKEQSEAATPLAAQPLKVKQ